MGNWLRCRSFVAARRFVHWRGGRRCLGVVLTVGLALALAGCGGDDCGDDGNDASGASLLVNYNEEHFARSPNLRATADDLVTLQLEDPRGEDDGRFDTGERPGVDVIPYVYEDTAERTFCWKIAGDDAAAAGAPSTMQLRDDASGAVVLEIEEGGECVTQTVAAGHYSAVFRNAASASGDRDLLFIVPESDAESTAVPASESGAAAQDEAPPPQAPTPYCDFAPVNTVPPFLPAGVMQMAVVDQGLGLLLVYVAGGCTDVTLMRDQRPRRDEFYRIATLVEGFKARVYEDLFFRGPRKTVSRIPNTLQYGFSAPASIVFLVGEPEANRNFLIYTNGCDGCDLPDVNLDGVDLHGAWLRRSDLSHASLEGANLSKVFAPGAIFKSAYLRGADLRQAALDGAAFDSAGALDDPSGNVYAAADLSEARLDEALLTNATLRGATLTGATLANATLDGVDLRGASAARAVFDDASMQQAQLSDATVSGASFVRVNLDGLDLRRLSAAGAVFRDASLRSALLTNATLLRASFDGARLDRANLQGASLANARMQGARLDAALLHKDDQHLAASLDGAYMANARLDSADLTGVSLVGARFYGREARAQGAIFDQASLVGANLSGADFTGASFRSAALGDAVCVNCRFNTARLGRTASQFTDAANFARSDLRGADFTQATVDGCNFTGATVSFSDTAGTYTYGTAPDVVYSAPYGASRMDKVTIESTVRCPNGAQGPCDTRDKLTAPQPTPTPTATATAMVGCTPGFGVFCSTATPTPVR